MVAEVDAVIAHCIDRVDFEHAAEFGVIGCTLIEVSGVKQEHIAPAHRLAEAVKPCCPFNYASQAGFSSASHRLEMAVGVVEMYYHQFLRLKAVCQAEEYGNCDKFLSLHVKHQSSIRILPSVEYFSSRPSRVSCST